jgi:hypothetical protein
MTRQLPHNQPAATLAVPGQRRRAGEDKRAGLVP